jgi:hypothetical protein
MAIPERLAFQKIRRKQMIAVNYVFTVVGIVVALLTLAFGEQTINASHLHFLFAVVLLILTLQITQVLQALILDNKLSEFSEIAHALDRLGDDRQLVEDLVHNLALVQTQHELRCKAAGIRSDSPTFLEQRRLLNERNRELLRGAVDNAKELMEGKFHTYFWSCRVLHQAVEKMRSRIIGLSPLVTTDDDWWTCPDGKEFLKINGKVKTQDKEVIRIFVYRPEQKAQLETLLATHSHATSQLYSIEEQRLKDAGFGDRHEAVAIVDDTLLFRADTGKWTQQYDRNRFYVHPERIREQQERLLKIMESATPHIPAKQSATDELKS